VAPCRSKKKVKKYHAVKTTKNGKSMNRHLHDNNPLPIAANEGWQQMQLLLHQHLPAKKQFVSINKKRGYAIAVLLFSVCMFFSFTLNTAVLFSLITYGNDVAAPELTARNILQVAKNNPEKNVLVVPGFSKPGSYTKPGYDIAYNNGIALPVNNEIPFAAAAISFQPAENMDENEQAGKQVTVLTDTAKAPAAIDKNELSAIKTSNTKHKPSWSLLAGAGININTGRQQNLQPYPMVVARYNISTKFYFSAAVTACSPVASAVKGKSSTVYLNDTANNVQLYTQTNITSPLYYADIPVAAGFNISKKFAVQAGTQLSVLLGKKSKKITSPYDYRMNAAATIPPPNVMPYGQTEPPVNIRKIDYRFTTGIRYTMNKTVIGLDYQYALRTAGKGNTGINNKVIALSVVLKIK
jgi:hypothetical protein